MKLYYLFSILFLVFNFINCLSIREECDIINQLLKIADKTNENYCCSFEGVTCSEDGHITNLDLSDKKLTGSIPQNIGQLTGLEFLWLSNNQLTGSIPSSIGDLPTLYGLNLSNNQLTGSIPDSLVKLTHMEGMYLNDNQLIGSIPGDISPYVELDINNNCIDCDIARGIKSNVVCNNMFCPLIIKLNKDKDGVDQIVGSMLSPDGYTDLGPIGNKLNDLFNDFQEIKIETCNEEDTCVRTSGIIKSGDQYYKISEAGNGNASYGTISGTSCSDNIGGMATIKSQTVLCLTESIYVPFTGDDDVFKYIMKKGTRVSPFDIDGGGKDIAITVGSFIYAFDQSLTDEVFSDHETNKILSRDANICSGDLFNTMYNCVDGVCSEEDVLQEGIYLHTADSQLYQYGANGWEKVEDKSGVMAFKKLDDCSDSILIEVGDNFEHITSAEDIVLQICTNGQCEGANGFVKYNTELKSLAQCTAGSCTENENVDVGNDGSCTEEEVGKANYDSSEIKICTANADSIYQFEIIDPDVKKILHLTANAKEYSTYEFDSTETNNALAILGNNLEGYYVINNNEIVTGTSTADGNILVLCNKTDGCVEQTTVGYYKNAGNTSSAKVTYIQCTYKGATSNACQVIAAPSGVSCGTGNIGLLTDDIKLCLGTKLEDGTVYVTSETFGKTDKYYLINNSENNANTYNEAIGNNEKGLIKITSNAMIFDSVSTLSNSCLDNDTLQITEITDGQDCEGTEERCKDGICTNKGEFNCDLTNGTGADCPTDGYLLIKDENGKKTLITANNKEGDLYYCKSGSGCTEVSDRGYIVDTDKDNYYVCKGGAKCKRYEFAENCSSGNIGQLIGTASSVISLCLYHSGEADASGITAELKENSGRYVVPLSDNTKYAFGEDDHEDKYYMVDVYPEKVLFKNDFISSVLYVYAYKTTYEVVRRGVNKDMCTTTDKMEFKYNAGVCTKRSN